jgi:ABC-type sugar transport system permease subunit
MMSRRATLTPYLFLLPAVIGLALFKFYPLINGLAASFFTESFRSPARIFVGMRNYAEALANPVFLNSLKVTLLFSLIVNPLQIALAMGLALFLILEIRGKKIFRTIHIIPITVSFPIACILWAIIMNPDQGLMNSILALFGIPNQPFLTDRRQALGSIIGIATWKGVGYWALFLIAGLEEISTSLYESAWIDGANRWVCFWRIMLPQMKRPLSFVVIADTVSNFMIFAPQYLITKGGPDKSTDFLMFEIFKNAYQYSNIGSSMAMLVLLVCLTLLVIAFETYLLRDGEK